MQNKRMCKDSVIEWGYQNLSTYNADGLRELVTILYDVSDISYTLDDNKLFIEILLHNTKVRITAYNEVTVIHNRNVHINMLSVNETISYLRDYIRK